MTNSLPNAGAAALENFLLDVRKPGRYIGGEFNSIVKPVAADTVTFALCFPDSYEVGMSHLGIKILYDILNKLPAVSCERCFAPWTDMEEQLRKHQFPLFTLESRRSVGSCDVAGFSLQYELSYANVLAMLELSGIPLRSRDRDGQERYPLIIAGGPCCYNPEPMAEFIDVFFIGEAEELIVEFIEEYCRFKKAVYGADAAEYARGKNNLLKRLSAVPGLYVPRFYSVQDINGVMVPRPLSAQYPESISRRHVADLEAAPFFTRTPVPFVEVVHDRISLEIMRGCPNRCFFCQAGFTMNPVRIRSVETLLAMAEQTYRSTGYDAVSFCALSSANYPYLKELIGKMHSWCAQKGVGISMPSLRIDKEFLGVIGMMSDLKKTGLTFAPEAGSERLRALVNKNIDISRLKEAIVEAYRCGWRRLKLYFMIGLPTEREADLAGICALIEECSALRKTVDGKYGTVSVAISNFIPKPHTPLQWLGMSGIEELEAKQKFLRARLWRKNFEVDFHDARMSYLEACLSRGDRRMGAVVEAAFRGGARFDAWTNMFNFDIWQKAFITGGLDAQKYASRSYELGQPLPWEHIYCGVSKQALASIAGAIAVT